MDPIEYKNYIVFGEEEVSCTSPTPEREVYFRVSFGRKAVLPKIKNHMKAAKTAVAKQLITPTFGAIQIHALEMILGDADAHY